MQSNLSSVRHVSLPAISSSVSSSVQTRKASRGPEPVEPFVLPEADVAAAGQRPGITPPRPQKIAEASGAEAGRSEAGRAETGATGDAKAEDPKTPGDAVAPAAPAAMAPQLLPDAALQGAAMPAPASPGDAATDAGGEADVAAPASGVRAAEIPQRPADIIALQAGLAGSDAAKANGVGSDEGGDPKAGGAPVPGVAESWPNGGTEGPVRTRAGRPEEFPGRIGAGAARAAEAGQGLAMGDPWTRAASLSDAQEALAMPVDTEATSLPLAQAPAGHDPGKPSVVDVAARQASEAEVPQSGAGAKQSAAVPLPVAATEAATSAAADAGGEATPVTDGPAAAGGAGSAGNAIELTLVATDAIEPRLSAFKPETSSTGERPAAEASVSEPRTGDVKPPEPHAHHERAKRLESAAVADAPQAPSHLAGEDGEAKARSDALMPAPAVEPASARDGAMPGGPLAPLPRPAETPAPAPHPATSHQMAELSKPLPPSALPIEIGLRALQGAREFQIRLDPAELGKVEVRLEIADDKTVTARVVVERVETLHLLQRDARTLERAFEQAGLKTSDGGVDISLRDHAQQGRDGRSEREAQGDWRERAGAAAAEPVIDPRLAPLIRRAAHRGALDLTI